MSDRAGKLAPCRSGEPITPSDSTTFAASRLVVVETAGNLTVDLADGSENITFALPAGLFPIAVTRIYSTATTASGISVFR